MQLVVDEVYVWCHWMMWALVVPQGRVLGRSWAGQTRQSSCAVNSHLQSSTPGAPQTIKNLVFPGKKHGSCM